MGCYRVNFVPFKCVCIYYKKIFFYYLLVCFLHFLFFLMMRVHAHTHTFLNKQSILLIELCFTCLLLFLIPRAKVDVLATVLCCLPSDIFLGDRNLLS